MASLLPLLLLLLLASTAVPSTAQSPPLVVKGRVFCDACGAGHFAKSSFYLAGAKVGVQCGSGQAHGGHVTAYAEGKTGLDGEFSIPVAGEHENDFCVALVLHSGHPTCNLISHRGAFAAVYLTRNAGLADNVIHTGPFSFAPNRLAPSCAFEAAAEEASISGGD